MPEVIKLRGIAWDHPRGYEPLRATSAAFKQRNPNVNIDWDIRSLKEFGDMPIESLIEQYDLITIDHPYMGQAHKNQLLIPLHKHIPADELALQKKESVGPSFNSYWYNNQLYALPIDAAALVSATRDDLFSKLDIRLPQSRKDLFHVYKSIPQYFSVAWPLCPTDLWCTFLTLCAQDGEKDFITNRTFDEIIGSHVLNELKSHLDYLHPDSMNWNPIQVLDGMSASDEIIYSPYLFGYTNYSRSGFADNLITFYPSPANPKTEISTIMGGVGLAISAQCLHPDQAVEFVLFTASSEIQMSIYTLNGGQPANRLAWEDSTNNKLCNDFFKNTLEAAEHVYVRPNHAGWNEFQEKGAELLHQGLVSDTNSNILMKELNHLYQSVSYEKQL